MIQRSTLKRDSSEQLAVVHSAFCNMASWWGWSALVDQKLDKLKRLSDEVHEKSKQIDDLQHQLAKEALAGEGMAEEITRMQSQVAEVCTRLQKAEGKLFNENGNYSKPDHGVEVEEEHSAEGENGSGTEGNGRVTTTTDEPTEQKGTEESLLPGTEESPLPGTEELPRSHYCILA